MKINLISGESYLLVLAIISAGRNNRYNHPSFETIETLDKLRIKYYNTQNSGTIIFQFNERLNNLTFCKP